MGKSQTVIWRRNKRAERELYEDAYRYFRNLASQRQLTQAELDGLSITMKKLKEKGKSNYE